MFLLSLNSSRTEKNNIGVVFLVTNTFEVDRSILICTLRSSSWLWLIKWTVRQIHSWWKQNIQVRNCGLWFGPKSRVQNWNILLCQKPPAHRFLYFNIILIFTFMNLIFVNVKLSISLRWALWLMGLLFLFSCAMSKYFGCHHTPRYS